MSYQNPALDLAVSMYMDEATMWKYFSSTASGSIDNQDFQGDVVPFAAQSKDEWIARKKFARAHRARKVTGPPAVLIKIKIPGNMALQHFLDQDIIGI